MKIATLLFTYNRSYHTQKVIDSLKNNTVLPQKIIVFQDGLRPDEDDHEWKKVNKLIHGIDWCDKEIIVSDYNKGLADSIVSGVNYALQYYDAVIVLEDDCVAAPDFIRFMVQCFEKYEKDEKVYSVSGYSWPIDVPLADSDIYFCGRTCTWGWGTWKNRWEPYEKDYMLYKRLKSTREGSRDLATWRRDVESVLTGNVTGKTNAWGFFWGLKVIDKKGLCINPYQSFIQNIGMDGSGVHCGITDRFDVELNNSVKEIYRLSDNITVLESTKEAFAGLYGSYTAVNKRCKEKEKILVYGLGNLFFQNERSINEKYYIEAFIDNAKTGYYAGKCIIRSKDIGDIEKYDKILIMIQDIKESMKISRELICNCGVEADRIETGCQNYGVYHNFIECIRVQKDGTWEVTLGKSTVRITGADQFFKLYESMIQKIYRYHIANSKMDIIFDAGMNVGGAALYFLQNQNVKKVYGFEKCKETYLLAKENLDRYGNLKGRYVIARYGDPDVFQNIMNMYPHHNYILKIDCEEEYEMLEKLEKTGLLGQFHMIMMNWYHDEGEKTVQCLERAGFSYWCLEKEENSGMIYAYK